ncbi:hypothetical protein N9R79_04395 [Vibrio sp.]|nr:hypothetical protein [Vibrio sp.]
MNLTKPTLYLLFGFTLAACGESSEESSTSTSSDSDGDGIADTYESQYGWDASDANSPAGGSSGDYDGDGLSNLSEITVHSTDPTLADTDGDRVDDANDVAPNNASSGGLSYVACNTPSFSYSSNNISSYLSSLSAYESEVVGQYYCPPTVDELTEVGYSASDYTSTVTWGSLTLATMTSAQADAFCADLYGGKLATDYVLFDAASTIGLLANDGMLGGAYVWPDNSSIYYIARDGSDVASNGSLASSYTISNLAQSSLGVSSQVTASSSSFGVPICFEPTTTSL